MIGVFVCGETSRSGVEKKECSSEWKRARYYGNGQYLLYSNKSPGLNLYCSVVAERYKDYEGRKSFNSFELSRNFSTDLEVEINGIRIFDGGDDDVAELQEGVYLRKTMSKRVLRIDEEKAVNVTLRVLKDINGREVEVARVSLCQENEAEENAILVKEDKVDSIIAARTYG